METVEQSYWYTEYQWLKNYVKDSKAKKSYRDYCKRQFHKARRRHDRNIIDNQLDRLAHEEHLLNEVFGTNYNRYAQVA